MSWFSPERHQRVVSADDCVFFDEKSKTVPVKGTLTVHGFETNGQGKDSQIKPFKFTPEQFTSHFSQSDFGASYSIWIPWDAAGGEEKRISLVPTFQTEDGKIVQGAPAKVLLPGNKPESAQIAESDHWSPKYHTHKDAVASHATRPSGLVTTTIQRHNDAAGRSTMLPSQQERASSMVVASRSNGADVGDTPFVDIQSSPKSTAGVSSGVMPASATMGKGPSRSVRSTRLDQTVPRRIVLPQGTK